MEKLYEFSWDYGRMGYVEGLFIADSEAIEAAIGKNVYFGEILGKHSEVTGTLEADELTVKSDNPDFIKEFKRVMGDDWYSGYNPLAYIEDEDG